MSIDRKELKKEAKTILRETKPHPVLVTLVIFFVIAVLQVLSMSLNGEFAMLKAAYEAALSGELTYAYAQAEGATGFGWLLTLAIELMAMVLSVGYTLYVLRISRHTQAGVGDMFDAFGLFFRAVCISIVPGLLVGAWSMIGVIPFVLFGEAAPLLAMVLLFVLLIPAIRAAYAYRLAVYITLDNPHLNCFQCIALSKAAMEGYKWELFKLDLSFLGWQLLTAIPFVGLWVTPYMSVTEAGFYARVMTDFAARRGMPRPPEFESGEGPGASE